MSLYLHPPIHTLLTYEYEVYLFCLLFTRREEKEVLTEITLNNGCLGSRNDEERSEMRYVV